MGFRLIAEAPGAVAGLAVAGASLPVPENSVCTFSGSFPPVMIVNGTKDPINPYDRGEVSIFGFSKRGFVVSSRQTADRFVAAAGISSTPEKTRQAARVPGDPTSVDVQRWKRDGRAWVALYTVVGGGHVVPQPTFRFPRLLGLTTSAIDLLDEAVEFFGLKSSAQASRAADEK